MKIKSTFLSFIFTVLCFAIVNAQTFNILQNTAVSTNSLAIPWNPNKLGTCAASCTPINIPNTNTVASSSPKGGGNNNTMNGNGTINTVFTASACGLNYVLGEVKTGKRYFPPGVNQPAPIAISGIPACRTILKAYLYTGGSGNGLAFSATVVNPASTTSVFPMTAIGNHLDKCWGYAGTYNYRADITALISGNGTYNVSGIPNSISTPGNDMDGVSIVIIYSDPTQAYTGHIVIGDGCQVNASTTGTLANTLTGFNSCAASNFAECFYIISDLQNILATGLQMNNAAYNFSYPAASNKWWDNIVGPATAVTAGQSSCLFGATNTSDCYNIVTEGLYWRTNCNLCAIPLAVTTATTSSCTVGSATAFATGGTGPYTYTWTPTASNNSVITNVPTGNYTVVIKDATGCNSVTSVVTIPAASATITASNATVCPNTPATLTVTGASTYTWQPGNIIGSSASFTPASTTVYTVIGTSAGGCTAQTTATITVNPLPVPLPNSNSPVCSGGNIILTVNAFSSYTWTGPSSYSSNLQNPVITNASTVNTGNYTVTVTSAQGCTASAVTNVIVNPTPTITVGNTGPYCAGATISLSVSAANTYTWTGPNAFNSNLQNPTIANSTTAMAGPYIVTVTTAGGCKSTGTTVVVVNPLPTPTITATSPVCVGKPINFTALGGNTYTWTGPNAYSVVAQNATIPSAILANAGNYTLTLTNTLGCTNTAVVNVVVNPLPVIVVNNPTVCVGSSFTLTATGGTAYAWSGPNVYSSALQNPPFASASTSLSGNYTVMVTGPQGCTNTAVASLSVVTLPTVSIVGTNTLCSQNFNGSPNTITLTATGAANFTWTLPGGFSATPNLFTSPIVVTAPLTSIQSVATISVFGTAGSCTSSAVYNVTVYPNPTITVNSASMCAGTSVTLTANNASTYTWSPATNLNTTSGPVVIANPANTTVYNIIGSSLGCNSQTQNSTVTVVPNPTVTITPINPAICLGNSITLTAAGATTYSWSPNVALSSTNTAVTVSNPTTTITYTVIGSAATCTNLATITVSVLGLPSVTVTPSSPTLCMNNFNGSPNTVSLTASGAASYTWGPIVGVTTNTLNGPLVIGTSNGAPVVTGTVIGANGTCTNLATFTLNAKPNPTIATTSGSMCAGTSVTLTASNATSYTWSPATNLNTTNGPVVIANPSVTTVYSVFGSSVGCNSQSQNATASVVPNPTVTITPINPAICLGNSITLTAAGATTYSWSPNVALSSTNTAVTVSNPTTTITYTVIGSAATCTNLATITVSVLGLPSVTVTPSSPTLCMNNFNGSPNTVSLTASGAASYTWGPIVGVTTNTLNGPLVIGTSNGAPVVTGTVIGANGTCTNISTFTVNAIANPTIATTSGSMCAGTSVTLSASNATSYTWSPSATLSSANGPIVTASPSVTTVYSVFGSSVGCNSQSQNATASVVANPTVSIAPLTPTICFGNSINLTASGATNYSWSPNTAISSTVGTNVTVNPTVTTTYTLIGEQTTCTNVAVKTVTVVPLPIININLSNGMLCMNNFNGSTNTIGINASGATSYNWTGFTGLTANTTNAANIIGTAVPPNLVGTGTVVGTVGTCSNTANFTVMIVPNPTLSVSSASMCFGTSAALNASGALTYTWSPANTLNTANGNAVIASPAVNTIYSIVGTSLNCNSPTQTATVIVVANPVIGVAPGIPTICAGSSIGLTAFGANNYTWSPASSLSSSTGNIVSASPLVTTNYTVIGEASTCTSSVVKQVLVTPLPQLQAVCERTAICLGEKTSINANGASSYTWIPSYGLTSNNSNFVVADPSQSTVYSLIGNNGVCTATLVVPINVITRPVLNLTTTSPKICVGNQSTIFASGAMAYRWNPPVADSLTPNMAIVTPSATMNYTVMGYNFSGTTGCVFTKEIEVEVVKTITATATRSVQVCKGESVKLNAGGSNTYVWGPESGLSNPRIAQPYASPKVTTVYTVHVSDGGNCATTATVLVKVNPIPDVNAGEDMVYNLDDPMYLNAKGTGTLTWIMGEGILCHDCPNSQIMPQNSGCYQIMAVDAGGCKAYDEVCIEVTKDYGIYIPNIFTPNYDGLNDVFLVYGQGLTKVEMFIFDRWGEKLYYSDSQLKGWDGNYKDEMSKNDVYTYLVNYTGLDGKQHTKTGHVTLLK